MKNTYTLYTLGTQIRKLKLDLNIVTLRKVYAEELYTDHNSVIKF